MEERRKGDTGAFPEQEITFYSELPPRGGVMEYRDVLEDVGRATRLDRADKALDLQVAGIVVLTAQQGDRVAGLTVCTLATASQRPPRLSVSVRRDHPVCDLLLASRTLAINFLGNEQTDLARRLSGAQGADNQGLVGVEYSRGVSSGAPILQQALGFVECQVAETLESGDHVLVVADILDGGTLHEGEPLMGIGKYKPTMDISDNLSVGS